MDLSNYTTDELINMVGSLLGQDGPTLVEIRTELQLRKDSNPESPTFEFIRPTRPNL